jgi:hypothetical protein
VPPVTILEAFDKPDHPPLYMDSNDISTVAEHKHLGLVISDNGSWEKHIDMITGKTYKRINILRKFKLYLQMLAVLSSLCSVASNFLSFCKIEQVYVFLFYL